MSVEHAYPSTSLSWLNAHAVSTISYRTRSSYAPPPHSHSMDPPAAGASVQRSNSLRPQSSNRIRPPTDLSSAPPALPPPQGYAPRHPDADRPPPPPGPNKPVDRVRGEEFDREPAGGPPRTRTGSDPNVRVKNARQVGDWQLGKTIGAGSMGKVKTATNVYTGEKVRRTPPVGRSVSRSCQRALHSAVRGLILLQPW